MAKFQVNIVLLIFLLGPLIGFGCINMFHSVDKEGKVHQIGTEGFIGFNENFNDELINGKLSPLYEKIKKTGNPEYLSDYAVLILKAGKKEEALHIFQSLQAHFPNEYELAANLGTAYELVGELDSAKKYIQLGMELNENAHEGSEWVHIAVLETKMNLENNPHYLDNHSVLGLSEEDKHDPEIRHQIEIQVRERFPFSPGPNALMASLMLDLADCYANTQSYELAKAFYSIAEYYFGADPAITQPKIDEMLKYRTQFKSVQVPEDQKHTDGMNEIISGVPYETIMDNNNDPPFTIDWENHVIDPEELLALVDLNKGQFDREALEVEATEIKEERETDNSESDNTMTIMLMVGASVCGMAFLFFLRRKK